MQATAASCHEFLYFFYLFAFAVVTDTAYPGQRLAACIHHDDELIKQPAIATFFIPEPVFQSICHTGAVGQGFGQQHFDPRQIVGMDQCKNLFDRQGLHLIRGIAGNPVEIRADIVIGICV